MKAAPDAAAAAQRVAPDQGPAETIGETTDILITVPHMGPGGAQRVVSLLLNHWQRRGLRLRLITLFPRRDAYPIDPAISRSDYRHSDAPVGGRTGLAKLYVQLEGHLHARSRDRSACFVAHRLNTMILWTLLRIRGARARLLARFAPVWKVASSPRVRWLRQRLKDSRPRVVIGFLGSTSIETVLASRGLAHRVIISERNDPARQQLEPPWERLRPRVYPRADLVTANSAGALRTMSAYVSGAKLRQVLNPLAVPACPAHVKRGAPRIISVGRLVEQKAPGVLIAAFARVAGDLPGWHLDMVGDGELRNSLEARVAAAGIVDRVSFHGHQADVYPLLYAASVFVLPSRFEGMPNAMLEAMGCGLAIVVSNASPGPLELIEDGTTGLVFPVDDSWALAERLVRICADRALRERLADAALKQATRMALPRVAADWEALIISLGVALPSPAHGAAGHTEPARLGVPSAGCRDA